MCVCVCVSVLQEKYIASLSPLTKNVNLWRVSVCGGDWLVCVCVCVCVCASVDFHLIHSNVLACSKLVTCELFPWLQSIFNQ